MTRIIKTWLRLADERGRLPHRWPYTGRVVAVSLYRQAEKRGWIVWHRIDDCYITDAGRAVLSSIHQ